MCTGPDGTWDEEGGGFIFVGEVLSAAACSSTLDPSDCPSVGRHAGPKRPSVVDYYSLISRAAGNQGRLVSINSSSVSGRQENVTGHDPGPPRPAW